MKFGPTSANSLPARIIWCVSDEAKAKLAALAIPGNEEKIRAAPVTAIIALDPEFYDPLPDFFPHTDARPWFAARKCVVSGKSVTLRVALGGHRNIKRKH